MNRFIQSILDRLQEIFDPEALGAQFADMLTNIIIGVVVFLVIYILGFLVGLVVRRLMRRSNLDRTAQEFINTIIKISVILIAFLAAFNSAGLNTGALIASLGVAGITVGFAARDALSNLISGFLIYLDRPFVIGDLVEIDEHYGRIEQITLRSTRVVTSDGKMLAVPNSEIINKTVASYTNFPHLRLDIPATIAVTEDIGRARQVLIDITREDPDYLEQPAPRVVVTELNDYNITLELQVWLRNEREHIEKRSELRENVFSALSRAGIEMPFETIQLTPLSVNLSGARGMQS